MLFGPFSSFVEKLNSLYIWEIFKYKVVISMTGPLQRNTMMSRSFLILKVLLTFYEPHYEQASRGPIQPCFSALLFSFPINLFSNKWENTFLTATHEKILTKKAFPFSGASNELQILSKTPQQPKNSLWNAVPTFRPVLHCEAIGLHSSEVKSADLYTSPHWTKLHGNPLLNYARWHSSHHLTDWKTFRHWI